MQLLPHNYAEIAAALVCTVCIFYKPSVTNQWFVGFLWLTVIVELTAKQLPQQVVVKNIMYNIFNVVEFVFYLSYMAVSSNKKDKRILKVLAIVIAISGVINFLLGQHEKKYNHYTTMLGSIMILFACLLIYRSLLSSKTVERVPASLLLISFGLMIFYSGDFFVYAFYDSLSKSNPSLFVSIYQIVNGYLNVFMYSCFAFAFITDVFPKTAASLVISNT